MKINDPTTVAAVRDAFDHYGRALMDNDLATLDALFWDHPQTTRYGPRETLYGAGALWKYAQLVGDTYKGAVTHPGAKAELHEYMDL